MSSPPSASSCNRRNVLSLGGGGLVAALSLSGIRTTQAQECSTLDANKALVYRVFEEVVNGGNAAVIAELYAPPFFESTRPARSMARLADMPVSIDEFRRLFPEISASIDDTLAEGDRVAARVTWRNVHPPAGTHIEGRTMHLFRITNEHIVEEWSAGWSWLDQHLNRHVPHPNPLLGA